MSSYEATKQARAVKLIDKLMKLSPDQGAVLRAMQIREHLMLPMSEILDKVPGKTVVAKAKACGVSRQNFYSWMRGVSRPNPKQAETISALTRYKADDIRGKTKLSRQTVASVLAASKRRPARPTRLAARRVKGNRDDLAV